MESTRKSGAAIALLVLIACASCRQVENPGKVWPASPTVEDTRSHEISRNPPPDLPVPRDMLYQTRENKSFSYLQGGVRVGRFHYWGNVPTDEVVGFYRERMPQRPYGWTFVNEQSQGPVTKLSFRKDSEHCAVSIGPENNGTVAVITLNTESTNP
jgi:hypothetical protein